MWRFLITAGGTMAVLIVLFAIRLGDLKSLPTWFDHAVAIIEGAVPNPRSKTFAPNSAVHDVPEQQHKPEAAAATPAPPPAVAEQQATLEAMQRQVAGLQEQLVQRSSELEARGRAVAAARAEGEKLQQGIDALHAQQKSEEELLARLKAQEQQAAITAPMRRPAPRPPTVRPVPASSTAEQLLTARQWLEAGRPDVARRVLAMVQTQMVLRPVTPDRPAAEGGNPSATDVGNAIRWLDMGASGQAMQAIDHAVRDAQDIAARGRPGYSTARPPLYGEPGMQSDYSNNGRR
jgi:hypothetical protein